MDEYSRVEAAAAHLRDAFGEAPAVAAVLGSGLSRFADRLGDATTIRYPDVPGWPASSVVGHRGALVVGELGGKRVAAMAGRVHMYEGYGPEVVVFGVRTLRLWGVETLIVTNAAGGIAPHLKPGDLMLITDHLNLQARSPLVGANDERFGPRFPDMTDAYDPGLREVALAAARGKGIELKEGVYAGLLGPSYETPAEVRMIRTLGGDAVGMSTVPEVIAARHMGMHVVGISCISNLAAGISDQPLDHAEVTETADRVREQFESLLVAIIAEI